MSGMAEVLAALEQHAPTGVSGFGFEYVLCRCDRTSWMKAAEFPTHQAAALTAAGFGSVADAKAEALEEAAARFDVRSETLLKTMQNMAGHPDTTPDNVVRYGAYSAESNTTATWLRARADEIRAARA